MKTHNFKIKEESVTHECILIERDDSVQYIFPIEVATNEKGAKSKMLEFKKLGSFEIENPMGFILDRISRLRDHNKSFSHVIVGNDEVAIKDNYLEQRDTRQALFVDGVELKERGQIVIEYRDQEGAVTHSDFLSHLKATHIASGKVNAHGVFAKMNVELARVPKKVDENGNPRFTKHAAINKLLVSNGIYEPDMIKGLSKALNDHYPVLQAVAESMKKEKIDRVYLELLIGKAIRAWTNNYQPTGFVSNGDLNYIVRKNKDMFEAKSLKKSLSIESILAFKG